jgi:hypothetical protein
LKADDTRIIATDELGKKWKDTIVTIFKAIFKKCRSKRRKPLEI